MIKINSLGNSAENKIAKFTNENFPKFTSKIHSYMYNKLYNNLVCLADDFIELKGGLRKK